MLQLETTYKNVFIALLFLVSRKNGFYLIWSLKRCKSHLQRIRDRHEIFAGC